MINMYCFLISDVDRSLAVIAQEKARSRSLNKQFGSPFYFHLLLLLITKT